MSVIYTPVVVPTEETNAPATAVIEVPVSKIIDTKEVTKIIEPIQTVVETEVTITDQPEFDIDAKIVEAKRLLREAEDKLDRGRFKEALSLAQAVNRIASEIETYKKLRDLDLAQKALEVERNNQKAEASASVK